MLSQFEELGRDPQMRQWLTLLSWGLWAIITATLIADFVIFVRWLLGRQRQWQREAAQFAVAYPAGVPQEIPVEAAPPAVIEAQESAEAAPEADAPLESERPSQAERTPWRWSVVHVFVGGQVVVLLANVLILLGMALLAIPIAMKHHGNPFAVMNDPGLERAMNALIVFGLYLQNLLFVGVAAFCLRHYGSSLARIGLARPTRRQVALGVGLGLLLFLIATGLELGLGKLLEHWVGHATAEKLAKFSEALGAGALFAKQPSALAKLLLLIAGAIAAPIGEEVFFRGFLYNALKYRYSVPVAIVVSGLVFAFVHISPLALLVIFPMGMFLAYIYERTGSLWVTICIHAMNNGLAFVLMWLFPNLAK
ncbi:MAG TPA: CPBP family intramembrane glutamic endopeptidase [Chthonomonadaceae bacterium]|nr:CPBP family intramembrane glutamic endopeptidase [Chthonomonadaceae bacterium]